MHRLFFILLLLTCASSGQGAEAPARVVSINLCTDQLLLMLADPTQIAAVSYLALEPDSSFMAGEAQRHPVNHGRAEELLGLKPDLILAGEYSDRALIRLMRRLGYRVEQFPLPSRIEGIRDNIMRMARLLGHGARGERLTAQLEQRLRQITETMPASPPGALFYQPNGYTSGRNTLQDTALRLAGWRNLAAELGIEGYRAIDLETLLLAAPQQLFTSPYAPGSHSLAQRQLLHPALRRVTAGREMIPVDYKFWICGGPMISEAVAQLHRSLPR